MSRQYFHTLRNTVEKDYMKIANKSHHNVTAKGRKTDDAKSSKL